MSEHASWSTRYYGAIIQAALAAAGAPADLVQIVTGYAEAGHALVTSGLGKLIFVGSTEVGTHMVVFVVVCLSLFALRTARCLYLHRSTMCVCISSITRVSALCHAALSSTAVSAPRTTGRKVMQSAAGTLTPVVLELGGKDAFIVCDDANLDTVRAHPVQQQTQQSL